ncbi:hypothetical protein [Gordonia sp. (in: high G+C Gram-positive bacteria)]|jgi:hypothetical protein|uniref:hypothetical protein n=1 Tax=Gordonia sp. (in: high G+C Gram-positive bacteria) TaxID=84139 RepID=UPI001DDAA65B|nr:hypothetical protein [Gordonia sp. (in: high G+C Gram-positive bacteria)]MCB1294053.1 hypothetical protein [Gordonia sp. (in: high G+C Gram-positive bacteria)]HMS76061.1 hypothetical protein [Gordonia sp. (in: high G+C Gram-positive bacteria)]HQV16820.1 hypothetical protein [Gordonia sp. (in: high G+C Gram-positive bacteria)]
MSYEWHVEAVDAWTVATTTDEPQTADEPLGTKAKFWVVDPDGRRCLFKYARAPQGRTMGEDWVEWAVHHLATMLSIPSATAIPATHEGQRGVLSRSVLTADDRLVHGNELLTLTDPEYDATAEREYHRYTIDAVRRALDGIAAPTSCGAPITTAFDAWAGYLMLDAWVAGRDRHHENWAVIERAGELSLAPSFDHGNALGFQVAEAEARNLSLDGNRLVKWARRGRSHHFNGRPGLVDLATTALGLADREARDFWIAKLAAVTDDEVASLLASVPADYLSDPARKFAVKLLHLNKERILDGD